MSTPLTDPGTAHSIPGRGIRATPGIATGERAPGIGISRDMPGGPRNTAGGRGARRAL